MRKKTIDTILVLSAAIKDILLAFSRSRSYSASLVKRSSIVLLVADGVNNQDIASKVGIHYNTVAIWRTRFIDALPLLYEVEKISPEKLQDEVKKLLTDIQRPGCPSVFTQEQIMKIIDLACKHPSEFGYEVSHWSLNLLVAEIKKQGIAEDISAKSVSRFLKMRQL